MHAIKDSTYASVGSFMHAHEASLYRVFRRSKSSFSRLMLIGSL